METGSNKGGSAPQANGLRARSLPSVGSTLQPPKRCQMDGVPRRCLQQQPGLLQQRLMEGVPQASYPAHFLLRMDTESVTPPPAAPPRGYTKLEKPRVSHTASEVQVAGGCQGFLGRGGQASHGRPSSCPGHRHSQRGISWYRECGQANAGKPESRLHRSTASSNAKAVHCLPLDAGKAGNPPRSAPQHPHGSSLPYSLTADAAVLLAGCSCSPARLYTLLARRRSQGACKL